MQMTNSEIIGKFKRADDKKNYIKILADLNGCSEEDIIEILRKNDIPESDIPKKRGRKPENKKSDEPSTEQRSESVPDVIDGTIEITAVTESEQNQEPEPPEMPEIIRAFIKDEVGRLTREIMGLEKIRDELCDYRDGRGKWAR